MSVRIGRGIKTLDVKRSESACFRTFFCLYFLNSRNPCSGGAALRTPAQFLPFAAANLTIVTFATATMRLDYALFPALIALVLRCAVVDLVAHVKAFCISCIFRQEKGSGQDP
jgi:hypothetical protein